MAAQNILYGIGIGLLICAAGISIGVIAAMIVPNWHRIARLVCGRVELAPEETMS